MIYMEDSVSLPSICMSQRLRAGFFKCLNVYVYIFNNGNGCSFLDVYVYMYPYSPYSFFSLTNNLIS